MEQELKDPELFAKLVPEFVVLDDSLRAIHVVY
jgi:hypothetical protein